MPHSFFWMDGVSLFSGEMGVFKDGWVENPFSKCEGGVVGRRVETCGLEGVAEAKANSEVREQVSSRPWFGLLAPPPSSPFFRG